MVLVENSHINNDGDISVTYLATDLMTHRISDTAIVLLTKPPLGPTAFSLKLRPLPLLMGTQGQFLTATKEHTTLFISFIDYISKP